MVNEVKVSLTCVPAPHHLQHLAATTLCGHMQLITNVRLRCYHLQNLQSYPHTESFMLDLQLSQGLIITLECEINAEIQGCFMPLCKVSITVKPALLITSIIQVVTWSN